MRGRGREGGRTKTIKGREKKWMKRRREGEDRELREGEEEGKVGSKYKGMKEVKRWSEKLR